jgi:hypothetical protein
MIENQTQNQPQTPKATQQIKIQNTIELLRLVEAGILNQAIRRPPKDRRILLSVLFSFSMVAFKRLDGLALGCLDPSSIYRLNLCLSGCLLVVFGFGKFY